MNSQAIDNQVRTQYLIQRRLRNRALIDLYDQALEQIGKRYLRRPPTLRELIVAAPFYRYGYIEWMIRHMAKQQVTLSNLGYISRYLAAFAGF